MHLSIKVLRTSIGTRIVGISYNIILYIINKEFNVLDINKLYMKTICVAKKKTLSIKT